MERAEKKGNKNTKRIPFIKMAKDPKKMESIIKQFNEEAKKQGSGSNPLVIDRIRADEFKKLQVLNFTVFGAQNTIDALMRIPSGDICLYGKLEGDKYLRPLETMNSTVVSVKDEVDQTITIGEEVFYDHFQRITNSKDGVTVILSPNLQINLTRGEIAFHAVSSVEDMYRDARFMHLIKNSAIIQHGIEASVMEDIKVSEGFDNQINHIIALYETMKMIGLDVTVPYSIYTDEQKAQLAYLTELKIGEHNDRLTEKYMKYLWRFGDKYVPLLIIKENNEIKLYNAVYTESYIICLPKEENHNEMGEQIPLFAYQSVDVLSNLYSYDYDTFRKQIDRCDITDNSIGTLIHVALMMINVYDKCGDIHFLDLSEYLLKRIEQHEQSDIITLNILQIKKRKGDLNESDINKLNEISSEDNSIKFVKNVLLWDREAALECFNKFSEEEKAVCMDDPIYMLLLQI